MLLIKSKNYISNPLFKLTKAESDLIKKPIHYALSLCAKGACDQTTWFNIMFRLSVGKYLIEKYYTEDTLKEFMEPYSIWEKVEEKAALTDHKKWLPSKEDIEFAVAGVEAVDELQDACSRKDLLAAHRYAQNELSKKYIHKGNKK